MWVSSFLPISSIWRLKQTPIKYEGCFRIALQGRSISPQASASTLNPDYVDAFIDRGDARFTKRDIEGVIADFSEAIRLKPDYGEAFYLRGIHRLGKDLKEGTRILSK